ncbi:MAG: putative lipid II flippase FtsW [Lysobacteraceae bacterium]|nr:MAG: putative lipid II flippase FtsW [Xanthomonadaceae bacterium]
MAFQLPFKFSGSSSDATIAARSRPSKMMDYDQPLVWVTVLLMMFGLVMVYSASIALPDSPKFAYLNDKNEYFLYRQMMYIIVSMAAAAVVFQIPVATWQKWAPMMFIGTLVLLMIVLIPGIGHSVNGARRWIPLKVMLLQPSEIMKIAVVLYAADFTVRKQEYMHKLTKGFLPMMVAIGLVGGLLLMEPDLGAFGVIVCIAMGILFLGGINIVWFGGIGALLVLIFSAIIALSPFRRARMFAYLDPWADGHALDKAYQLTHSLIAFGRGEFFGVGLGGSVEKLFYLPEAHTDFIMAVIGEELGLAGVLVVIAMFYWLVKRAFDIGRQAIALDQIFAGLAAKGIGIWIGAQTFINMGVNLGLLPTKGLTLPLMSFGGSGVLFNCVGLAILLRIDYENRVRMRGGRT